MYKKLFILILFLSLTQCMPTSTFDNMPSQVGVADSTGTPLQNIFLGVGTAKRVQMWTYDNLGNSLGPASSNSMIQVQLTQTSNPQVAAPYAALPGCIFANQISKLPVVVQVSGNTLNHGQLIGQAFLYVNHDAVVAPSAQQTDIPLSNDLSSGIIQSSQGALLSFVGLNNNSQVKFFRADSVGQTTQPVELLMENQWSSLSNIVRPALTSPIDLHFQPQYKALGVGGVDNSNLFAISYEYITHPNNPPVLQSGQTLINTPTYVGLSLYDSLSGRMVSKTAELSYAKYYYWNSAPAKANPPRAQERYFNVEKTKTVYLKKNNAVLMVGYGEALQNPQVTTPAQTKTYHFFGSQVVAANLNQFDKLPDLGIFSPGVTSATLTCDTSKSPPLCTDLNFKVVSNDVGDVRLFFISDLGAGAIKVDSTLYSPALGC